METASLQKLKREKRASEILVEMEENKVNRITYESKLRTIRLKQIDALKQEYKSTFIKDPEADIKASLFFDDKPLKGWWPKRRHVTRLNVTDPFDLEEAQQ